MYNELVIVVCSPFQSTDPTKLADKNGKKNIWLTPVAGKIPNQAMVIAGTVAEKAGLVDGKTLLIMVNEGEPDAEYGRQFNVTNLGEVPFGDILGMREKLGSAAVVVTKVVGGAENNPLVTSKVNDKGEKEEEEDLTEQEKAALAKANAKLKKAK